MDRRGWVDKVDRSGWVGGWMRVDEGGCVRVRGCVGEGGYVSGWVG